MKSYKLKKTYLFHLRSHNASYSDRFRCDLCDYKGVDKWNLRRHKLRQHRDTSLQVSARVNATQLAPINIAQTNQIMRSEATENNVIVNQIDVETDMTSNDNEMVENGSNYDVTDGDENNELSEDYVNVCELSDDIDEVAVDLCETNDDSNELDGGTLLDKSITKDSDESSGSSLSSRKLSRYEEIRLSIIQERNQRIADSGILESIDETKNEIIGKKKASRSKNKNNTEKPSSLIPRRSQRVENLSAPPSMKPGPDSVKIKKEYEIEIKLEFDPDSLTVEGDNSDIDTGGVREDLSDDIDVNKLVGDIIAKVLKSATKDVSNKFECTLCAYCARDNYNLKRHIEIQHSEIQVKCLICDNVFPNKFSFEEHLNNCFYDCPYDNCSKRFKIKSRFESHRRMHIKLLSRY